MEHHKILLLNSVLSSSRRRNYELRGAEFQDLSSITKADDIPNDLAVLVLPISDDPLVMVVKKWAEGKGIKTRSTNSVSTTTEILDGLPPYNPTATLDKQFVQAMKDHTPKGLSRKKFELPGVRPINPASEQSIDKSEEARIRELKGQVATLIEVKKELQARLDWLMREKIATEIKNRTAILALENENQRLRRAIELLPNLKADLTRWSALLDELTKNGKK